MSDQPVNNPPNRRLGDPEPAGGDGVEELIDTQRGSNGWGLEQLGANNRFPPDLVKGTEHEFPIYRPPQASAYNFARPRLRFPPSPPKTDQLTNRILKSAADSSFQPGDPPGSDSGQETSATEASTSQPPMIPISRPDQTAMNPLSTQLMPAPPTSQPSTDATAEVFEIDRKAKVFIFVLVATLTTVGIGLLIHSLTTG